jgi:hypothetical protein
MADATENLVRVARALRRIGLVDVVFVGGAAVASGRVSNPRYLAARHPDAALASPARTGFRVPGVIEHLAPADGTALARGSVARRRTRIVALARRRRPALADADRRQVAVECRRRAIGPVLVVGHANHGPCARAQNPTDLPLDAVQHERVDADPRALGSESEVAVQARIHA